MFLTEIIDRPPVGNSFLFFFFLFFGKNTGGWRIGRVAVQFLMVGIDKCFASFWATKHCSSYIHQFGINHKNTVLIPVDQLSRSLVSLVLHLNN